MRWLLLAAVVVVVPVVYVAYRVWDDLDAMLDVDWDNEDELG